MSSMSLPVTLSAKMRPRRASGRASNGLHVGAARRCGTLVLAILQSREDHEDRGQMAAVVATLEAVIQTACFSGGHRGSTHRA